MHGYIDRFFLRRVLDLLEAFPAVALLGPRQVGKSTFAKEIGKEIVYMDLQDPRDLQVLEDPMTFLEQNQEALIVLDEIQRMPGLFSPMRAAIDANRRNGRFLILGSASRDLIRQSAETLAGRIAYFEVPPFRWAEVERKVDFMTLWRRGGLPLSLLAKTEGVSFDWRKNYIQSFLERDIPQLGFQIPAVQMGRLWQMLAHSHGQPLNQSQLGQSMGMSGPTIRRYIDLLEQTFMIRQLPPFYSNLRKRLIKSPKVYLRDTGLLHSLLNLETHRDLSGHPILGLSYESFVIEQLIHSYPDWRFSFLRTSNGAEVDLVAERSNETVFVEIKVSSAPKIPRGFRDLIADVQPTASFLLAPVPRDYSVEGVLVRNPERMLIEKESLLP